MTLTRYLSRVFATRILAVLLAMSALAELVALLDAMRRLLGDDADLSNVVTFGVLRLPLALEQLFLLAVLVGAALAFRALAVGGEMAVLRAAGVSPYRILAALLPLALALGLVHFLLADRIAPAAERQFVQWWATLAETGANADDESPRTVWLRSGDAIVAIAPLGDDPARIGPLTIFRRDAEGLISRRVAAASAEYVDGGWRLRDVETTDLAAGEASLGHATEMAWDGPTPANLAAVAHPTQRLTSTESRAVLRGDRAGAGTRAQYRTILQSAWRAPLLPLLMILLALPSGAGGRRIGGMGRGMALSLLLGLCYLILDGVLSSMSTSGAMPAGFAIWVTPALFAAIAGAVLLYAEE